MSPPRWPQKETPGISSCQNTSNAHGYTCLRQHPLTHECTTSDLYTVSKSWKPASGHSLKCAQISVSTQPAPGHSLKCAKRRGTAQSMWLCKIIHPPEAAGVFRGRTFAGTVKKPKMLRCCAPVTALSIAISPKTSPESPTAQEPE